MHCSRPPTPRRAATRSGCGPSSMPCSSDTPKSPGGWPVRKAPKGSAPCSGGRAGRSQSCYIGATRRGVTTTLGRGGSDYSAALVGAALAAAEIQIWTDVSGVLTADPRVVPGARTIPTLSYAEAAELAYFGAKVLHPKTLQPAMDRDIPVRICNSHAPGDPATLVTAHGDARAVAVKAIAPKSRIPVLQDSSTRMLGAYGFLRGLVEWFEG